jgi:hypothetical protein
VRRHSPLLYGNCATVLGPERHDGDEVSVFHSVAQSRFGALDRVLLSARCPNGLEPKPNAGLHVEKLSELYGHEVGAYLGYCPPALLAYLLPLLALSPVLVLLAALADEQPAATNAIRKAVRLAVLWVALNASGLLLVTLALTARHGGDSQAGG